MTYKSKGIRTHKENCMCIFHGGRISKKGISHVAGCMCPWHGGKTMHGGYNAHKPNCSCIFCSNSRVPLCDVNISKLKLTAIKRGLLVEHCYICGAKPLWMGQPLTLQLDHIDGDSTNNIIENLRLLCPNCHSQTSTFGGRNIKRPARPTF